MPNKRIQDLTPASSVQLNDLFVLEQSGAAKSLTGQILVNDLATFLNGHGGINDISYTPPVSPSLDGTLTITMADESSYTLSVTNGRGITGITWSTSGTPGDGLLHTGTIAYNDGTTSQVQFQDGVKGDRGFQTYVWIKWAQAYPTQDSDMLNSAAPYIGICATTASTAPTTYTSYTWYEYKGEKGDTGATIGSIELTSTTGLVDTYTITLTNGNTSTFTVTNAKSIISVVMTSGSHAAGTTDIYTITFNDGDTANFSVYNGANGLGSVSTVSGIQADGNGDVPQVISGNGAPTTATIGQENQLYYDLSNSVLYYCAGESGGTYVWMGTGVTVDSALSGSSTNPVQNAVITNRIGTGALPNSNTNLTAAINYVDGRIPSAATQTPLADVTNGAVGTGTNFARNDHKHPLNVATSGTPSDLGTASQGTAATYSRSDHVHKMPDASDILLSNGNSVQSTVEYLPMWRGKKALIIGDSWTNGWNGSSTITPWTSTFLSMTGMTATIIPQSSAGFTVGAGQSGATYPGETFVQVLEHVKTDSFDMIVVQGGVNDIVNSTGDISTALTAFKTNCGTYWPYAPVFLFVTVPFYYLTGTLQPRAVTLVNTAAMLGYYIDSATALLSKSGSEYKGTDRGHPSADGQTLLGRMAANYVTGHNIDIVPSVVTYPTDSYAIKDFAFGSASSSDYYVRCVGKHITVYIVATINSTATGGFITIATGMPLSEASYTFLGTAVNRTDHTAAPVPVYINGENLIIQNFTNASLKNKSLLIAGSYTTKSL